MRQLNGTPLNSSSHIIGKISKNPSRPAILKKSILVTSFIEKIPKGISAVLCSSAVKEPEARQIGIPIVHSVDRIEELSEGDIVSVDMATGDIIVVFEKNSIHNSIVASTECNCRCLMCPQSLTPNTPELLKDNIDIIRLFDKNITALGITGGEPLVLGAGFIKLLRECRKRVPDAYIQILTNGILLKDIDFVRKIAKLKMKHIAFCVPLYADTDKEHDFIMQRSGAFEDTILGLYNLASLHLPVEIRIVVMSLNFKRLPQIADFVYHNFPFVFHVAFMGMEVEGQAKKNIRKLWISPVDYMPYLKEAVIYLSLRNIDVSIYNEQLCLVPSEIHCFLRKSISEWKNTYLDICLLCKSKNDCAGFFAHPEENLVRLIRPL